IDNKGKRKHHDNTKDDPNKNSKVTCWKCVKPGHLKKDCKGGKVGNKANGSGTNGSVDGSTNSLKGQNMFNKSFQVYYVTYVYEAYFLQDDDVAWWVNSGATVHVCKDRCWFKTYESLNDGSILHMKNESTALVHGRGCVDLKFSSRNIISLFNVLHVPNIRKNLLSSSVLNNYGYKQVIESNKFVLSKHGMFTGFGYLSNQMFRLNIVNDNITSAFMSTSKLNDSILWHARLGHVHFKRMQDMSKDGLIPTFDMDTEKCKTGMLNKITKKPFKNVKRETKVLELIHSDLCYLHATPSLGNKKYFMTFIDDASRFSYVYLLHLNDEALNKFKEFKTKVELQQGSQIKRFRTDKGGLSQGLWGEAMLTACYLLNRVPNKRNGITPYELLTKRKPNLNYLRVWGYRAIVRLPDPKLKTLGERGIECIFVGYAENSKAFRLYVIEPNDSASINSIIESRDAIFDENRFSSVHRPSLRILNGTEDIGGSVVFEEVTEEVDGTIEKFKARLVIQGFKQKSGIDYFDTYAPVAHISTIRLLIVMTSIHNLIIHQMNVKTTFLNGDLDEEQAPKQWHQNFDEVVLSNCYLLNQADKCVYSKFDETSKGVIICLCVDDMLIFGTNQVQVDMAKEFLSSRFSMKDMREADVILVSTPMDTSKKLMPNNGQVVSQLEYSRVIGCLMYAMTCTRPNIAFVVGKLSRYTSNPVLEGYTDASWISNTEDNSSTSGWVFLLGGGAIFWASKKQTCITGSTMESEFMALAAVGKEAEWLKNLLLEISLWSKPIAPIYIRCDSGATLAKAYSQMYNGKSRHLGVRHSMIHELITNGVISIEFVRSQQNLADHLTKGVARDLVIKSAEGTGLKSN
ncbi:zinc finger, CCHC-type containing protein, partial [Tanacetum coccineum]